MKFNQRTTREEKPVARIKIIDKLKTRESKWVRFNKFMDILKKYVENEYYGGLECKIEKGKIVDSKDWRRRKYEKDED